MTLTLWATARPWTYRRRVLTNDSDPEGDALTAVLVSGPAQGVLELIPAGGFTYTPTNHFSGVETFSYQSQRRQTNSGPATVSIGVSNPIQITSSPCRTLF